MYSPLLAEVLVSFAFLNQTETDVRSVALEPDVNDWAARFEPETDFHAPLLSWSKSALGAAWLGENQLATRVTERAVSER